MPPPDAGSFGDLSTEPYEALAYVSVYATWPMITFTSF